MRWVKANGYIFRADEVIAICPIGPVPGEPAGADPTEVRSKVILRAGVEIELRGGPAQRFREMFLESLGGNVQDHDAGPVQVNETRVFVSEVDAPARPAGGRPS
jgi:hypothetical protein